MMFDARLLAFLSAHGGAGIFLGTYSVHSQRQRASARLPTDPVDRARRERFAIVASASPSAADHLGRSSR